MSAFISYSHRDRALARRLSEVLSKFDLEHWWDDRIELSARWSAELERRLLAATSIVVLWTSSSTQSEWVCREATFAAESSKLVQLRISNATLPHPFAELQAADVPVWEEGTFPRGIRRALNSIAAFQAVGPVLDEYTHIYQLTLSDSKVMQFLHHKKHREGHFPKLDGPLYKDIWEMQMAGRIKLYDELHPGSRHNMDEERYYELIEYLSDE